MRYDVCAQDYVMRVLRQLGTLFGDRCCLAYGYLTACLLELTFIAFLDLAASMFCT